jgi:hypothetical protein
MVNCKKLTKVMTMYVSETSSRRRRNLFRKEEDLPRFICIKHRKRILMNSKSSSLMQQAIVQECVRIFNNIVECNGQYKAVN